MTQPQEQNDSGHHGNRGRCVLQRSERWNRWQGNRGKLKIDLTTAHTLFSQGFTTHSLLEMQAYHGFLADSNIQKNPRAGQTPTQDVVSLDCSMSGGRVLVYLSLFPSPTIHGKDGMWERSKEFIYGWSLVLFPHAQPTLDQSGLFFLFSCPLSPHPHCTMDL